MKRSAPDDPTPRGVETQLPRARRGLPGIQRFRRLSRRYPHLEAHEIWALCGYGPQERALEASSAGWADGRATPSEAWIRNDPRPD